MHKMKIEKSDNWYTGTHIIHNLNRPLQKRLEARKHTGAYYMQSPTAGKDEYRSFYLDSDFMPTLRHRTADEILTLSHTGWFCDDMQLQTIYGLVFRLPHERGFLAGWSMGEGMASTLDTTIYDDEEAAAYIADSMAENAAENEREYQQQSEEG